MAVRRLLCQASFARICTPPPHSHPLSRHLSTTATVQDTLVNEINQELESIFGGPLESGSSLTAQDSASHEHSFSLGSGNLSHEHSFSLGSGNLSHVDDRGRACMVDVSGKAGSKRVAVASGKVCLGQAAFSLVAANQIAKGDVLTVAKVAGICGAKHTATLIPLCHNIALNDVQVDLSLDEGANAVVIRAEASSASSTGVEMEALTAVSVAGLTVYDMCKAVSKEIKICDVQLESKTGGKSGNWSRSSSGRVSES